MAKTFLEYLTLPNPEPKIVKKVQGPSTRSKNSYGPDNCTEWEDFTWTNLKGTFKNVLDQEMRRPKVRDLRDIPSEKTEIFEEASVTSLCIAWNEAVLRHVFEGTHEIMSKNKPEGPLGKGCLYLHWNTGRGNMKNKKGIDQKPDWCTYQKVANNGPYFPNIVPGDSKPASKWKSEWINSENPEQKRKAWMVMTQITRYMWDAKTRYGFIISEEELVPVRLSVYPRDMPLKQNSRLKKKRSRIEQAERRLVDGLEESDTNDDDPGSDTGRESHPPSNASFADNTRKTGLWLEYCRVPWSAKGTEGLTINLALWWLPVLAVQNTAIKKIGTYTSLGERRRGQSPEFDLAPTERELFDKVYGEQDLSRKRGADHSDLDDSERPSKILREPRRGSLHGQKIRARKGRKVNREVVNLYASSSDAPESFVTSFSTSFPQI